MLGTLLGNYRVVAQLGKGGMGIVYVGRHEALGHRVVLKVLRPEMSRNADMVRRFFNEAQAATAIRHPGIVQIFDFGRTPDDRAYFAMELLEGETLGARIKQRRLDCVETCRIGRQVANVLQATHAAGITHRDLKPDNLFLVPDAEVTGGERVKVLDFGIAKLAGELYAVGVRTRTDLVMGTPSYMAPEQCRGAGAVDTRADIYSLGCILFKMCCGRPPFLGRGAVDVISAHLYVPPPELQRFAPDVVPELAGLIARMLEKQPDARPQTMAAVSQALDEILRARDGEAARPPTSPPRLSPPTGPLPGRAGAAVSPATTAWTASPAPSLATTQSVSAPPLEGDPTVVEPWLAETRPAPPRSSGETALGGAARVPGVPPLAGGRRRALVIGGGVAAGALTSLLLALGTRSSSSTERLISYDEIEATPRAADAAPEPSARIWCDPEALAEAARQLHAAGKLWAALTSYEASWRCKPTPQTARSGFIVACMLGDLPRAKLFWTHLPREMQESVLTHCESNRITEQMLDDP